MDLFWSLDGECSKCGKMSTVTIRGLFHVGDVPVSRLYCHDCKQEFLCQTDIIEKDKEETTIDFTSFERKKISLEEKRKALENAVKVIEDLYKDR